MTLLSFEFLNCTLKTCSLFTKKVFFIIKHFIGSLNSLLFITLSSHLKFTLKLKICDRLLRDDTFTHLVVQRERGEEEVLCSINNLRNESVTGFITVNERQDTFRNT